MKLILTLTCLISLQFILGCSKTSKKAPPPNEGGPVSAICVPLHEIKTRLTALPEILVRLGGTHRAVRSYKHRPANDYFNEGHKTSCDKNCPQSFDVKFHLPSDNFAVNQPKTFHIALELLSGREPSRFDFRIDDLAENESDLSGEKDTQKFFAKAIGQNHIYVEWQQTDQNSAANREKYVLVELLPTTDEQLRSHVNIQGRSICP